MRGLLLASHPPGLFDPAACLGGQTTTSCQSTTGSTSLGYPTAMRRLALMGRRWETGTVVMAVRPLRRLEDSDPGWVVEVLAPQPVGRYELQIAKEIAALMAERHPPPPLAPRSLPADRY